MKNHVLLTALTASLLGLGLAQAQPPKDSGRLFDTLDTNADGQLNADELGNMRAARAEQRFARADANGDGSIDKDEFMARADERAERMFSRMDRNDDGLLAADEATPRHHGHGKDNKHGHRAMRDGAKGHKGDRHRFNPMKHMDSDDNGVISRAEWDAAAERHHPRRGARGA